MRNLLQAVADAEHRDAELEDGGIAARRSRRLDRRGPAREHDAARRERLQLGRGEIGPVDLAVHPELATPAGDQLRVLTPEVEDQDLLGVDIHQLVLSKARLKNGK